MNRLVYSVFKAIMLSIIFVFVFDMAFYMYRAFSLNSRMESISTSLQKVVMENNYLPEETAKMYQNLFGQLIVDFNGGSYSVSDDGRLTLNDSEINNNFISGFHWNYKTNATGVGMPDNLSVSKQKYNGTSFQNVSVPLLNKSMKDPADYGTVTIVQLRVGVFQPLWGWGSANGRYDNTSASDQHSADKWVRSSTGASTEFVYNYYVPCLQYKTTNY